MKQENKKYYTTRYSWQMVICSLVYIAVNIAMYDIFYGGTALGLVIIVIIQTTIINSVLNYLIFGIVRNKEIIFKIVMPAMIALGNILIIAVMGDYFVLAHIGIGIAMAAESGRALRHINGDNLYKPENADEIFEKTDAPEIRGISAYFPVDMGNRYKKLGIIKGAGKAAYGKYAGEAVAFMECEGEIYACPIRKIRLANAAAEALFEIYSW